MVDTAGMDMDEEELMGSREAMKALAAVQMARDHAKAERHGPATAFLMQASSFTRKTCRACVNIIRQCFCARVRLAQ